ncbi:MAG: PD-(D/E)XK nuclease family protein, partial [Myxococcales bacterium]|nr:PD-(D/E)XK nuclease family protein [Myxococcales bacterium]
MPALRAISPSQVKAFTACPRKWAFDKIDGVPRPGSPSTDLGTRVHEILEAWLLSGAAPDLTEEFRYTSRAGNPVVRHPGRIAHAGLHMLPAPLTPGLEVEGWMRMTSPAGPWIGRLDLRYPCPETGVRVVHDHKTTGSPRYAQTPDTLRTDPQALLYAAHEMKTLGVDRARLDWAYFPTDGKTRPWKVSLT